MPRLREQPARVCWGFGAVLSPSPPPPIPSISTPPSRSQHLLISHACILNSSGRCGGSQSLQLPPPAPAVEVPAVPLTRNVMKKRQRKTDCKVTEIVDGTIADAVMAEVRQQEASMGAQVTARRPLQLVARGVA